jgi:hypothetical protein
MGNWPAMLLAPTLTLTNLSITYALVTPSCTRQSTVALHAVSAITLMLALYFTYAAWRNWRRDGTMYAGRASDDVAERGGFVALVATMIGVLSCLVVAAQWFPQWMLSPCTS